MKKMIIFISLCIMFVPLTVYVITSLTSYYSPAGADYSRVIAIISEDYYENFDTKAYTLENFNLSNAKSFEYRYMPFFDEEIETEIMGERFFVIKLKKTGKRYANAAIDNIIQLEFIKSASVTCDCAYNGELY